DHKVAVAAAIEHGHARAALAQLLARLDACRDADVVPAAVEPWNADLAAERCGCEADRGPREQRGSFALEDPVPRHVKEDVEVARCCAARTAFPLARQANARTLVHSGRNVDGQRLAPLDAAFAMTGGAGVRDDLARALTGGTGALDHEEALLSPHLAVTAAGSAAMGGRARPGPGAVAGVAARGDVDLDFTGATGEGVLEPDFHVIAKVSTARGATLLLAAAECRSEDRFKNVANVTEIGPAAKAVRSALDTRLAEAIIG